VIDLTLSSISMVYSFCFGSNSSVNIPFSIVKSRMVVSLLIVSFVFSDSLVTYIIYVFCDLSSASTMILQTFSPTTKEQ